MKTKTLKTKTHHFSSLLEELWENGGCYAPVKVNPVGEGGVWARGGDLMPETIPLSGF